MAWEIEVTDEYTEWYWSLKKEQCFAVDDVVEMLAEDGPQLGRPYADRIAGSSLHNLKELRCSADGKLRILFVFDPRRTAILLLGGDKTGEWETWYTKNIPQAEVLYEQYLTELAEEGTCSPSYFPDIRG